MKLLPAKRRIQGSEKLWPGRLGEKPRHLMRPQEARKGGTFTLDRDLAVLGQLSQNQLSPELESK